MTSEATTFDPAWDQIDTSSSEVAEFEGGKLYKKNALHVVVLNGTYYEMGRQYGHLLKDLIHWHLGELENESLVQTVGNNPVDRPAPLLSHEELKRKFMPGYYRAQPHNLKRMLQGAAETSGLTLKQMVSWTTCSRPCSCLPASPGAPAPRCKATRARTGVSTPGATTTSARRGETGCLQIRRGRVSPPIRTWRADTKA